MCPFCDHTHGVFNASWFVLELSRSDIRLWSEQLEDLANDDPE